MHSFDIEYSLSDLLEDPFIVSAYEDKDKVIISGTEEGYTFLAVYAYTKTQDGEDWYQLMQCQRARIQE